MSRDTPDPGELAANAESDLRLVEGKAPLGSCHLSEGEWVRSHARNLIDALKNSEAQRQQVEDQLRRTIGVIETSTELSVSASRALDRIRGLVAAFRRVTGARRGSKIGHTPFRWRAAQNLATEVEREIAEFLERAIAGAKGRPPRIDPERSPRERAQKLADVMNQVEESGFEGPEVERFRKATERVRRHLLGDDAVEGLDPADGGKEN